MIKSIIRLCILASLSAAAFVALTSTNLDDPRSSVAMFLATKAVAVILFYIFIVLSRKWSSCDRLLMAYCRWCDKADSDEIDE